MQEDEEGIVRVLRSGGLESGHDIHFTESIMVVTDKTGTLEEVRVNTVSAIVAVATAVQPRQEECIPGVEAVFLPANQTVLRVR